MPYQISSEAFVVTEFERPPGAPVGVHLNSMVLRSAEPVLFDTGAVINRSDWREQVGGVVDFADVRWIVLTHEDADHVGNLDLAIDLCPNATVVTTWFMAQRMLEVGIDPRRMRWVGPDETLDIGDRILSFVRPPLYDSPTTRAVVDPVSGVAWGADLFAVPVEVSTDDARSLPADALAMGFGMFQQWNSPWVSLVDRGRYEAEIDKLATFDISAIASTHGPAFVGDDMVATAFDLLRGVPDVPVIPQPGQPMLDEIVASVLSHQDS